MPNEDKNDGSHPNLSEDDLEQIEEHQVLRSPVLFEIIREEGLSELSRPKASLLWSGIAAGIAIGFSVLAEAVLRSYLPDAPWRPLVENIGYSVGFLLVILARLQLFTENTITPILPLFADPNKTNLLKVARLWSIVFIANMLGAFLFSLFFVLTPTLNPEVYSSMIEISDHMMHNSWWEMLAKGIVSGWLIAMLVWLLPSSEGFEFWVILLVTYMIAAGDFTHIVAGAAEAFLLLFEGKLSIPSMVLDFMIPVLLGNIIGGTVLFSLISYGQVRKEI